MWGVLLAALILAIAMSGRIRLGAADGKVVDVRGQDFLLPLILLLLVMSTARLTRLRALWGPWAVVFSVAALITTLLNLILSPALGVVRSAAFLGRALEPLLLGIAVASVYVAAGDRAGRVARCFIEVGIWSNLLWFLYQHLKGFTGVAFGKSVGDLTESYGPKLIGEPSSFGTGFFFAFSVAYAVAALRLRVTVSRVAMLPLAVWAAYQSQSRASLLAIVVILWIALIPGRGRSRGVKVVATVGIGALVAMGVIWATAGVTGRLGQQGVESSANVRVEAIWKPLIAELLAHPLTGIGPGALGTPEVPYTEAHNIVLRAFLDFGVFGAIAMFAMLVTIGVTLYRTSQGGTDLDARFFSAFAFMTLIAAVVTGLVQDSFTAVTSTHLLWLTIGLAGGAISRMGSGGSQPAEPRNRIEAARPHLSGQSDPPR